MPATMRHQPITFTYPLHQPTPCYITQNHPRSIHLQSITHGTNPNTTSQTHPFIQISPCTKPPLLYPNRPNHHLQITKQNPSFPSNLTAALKIRPSQSSTIPARSINHNTWQPIFSLSSTIQNHGNIAALT
jgi:hypothetical protein